MTILRTALVSTLLGIATASFAAMPSSDPASREARMQEALDNFHAKQSTMDQGMMQPTHHAMHHHAHAAKHMKHMKHMKQMKSKTSQDDNAKAKDQTQ